MGADTRGMVECRVFASQGSTTFSQLEETTVPPYPVTVNSSAPPQEPGTAPAPSGLVACKG